MSEAPAQQLAEDLAFVRELIIETGEMLLQNLDNVGHIDQKAGTEFVTDLDRRAEDQILTGLAGRFPDDNLVAEESGGEASLAGRTWYIDPLDGTTNYAHGYPFFSVSIACADADELLLGAVYAPYLDELYLARTGGGAVQERPAHGTRKQLAPRVAVPLDRALLATGFPYVRDRKVDLNAGLVADFLKARCHGVRRGGSAAVDLVHVAAGKLDGYWEQTLRPWDTAAGTLIAREAGALVSDWQGRQMRLHYQGIVAAAPELHGQMLQFLAGAAAEVSP